MSENRQIARAAGLVGFLTLFSRIAGLTRDAVIGYYFGSGMAADAFFVAFRVPNLLRRFVAEGAMSVAFIPVFSEYLTRRTRQEALEAARAVATGFATVLAILTALGIIFAPLWTRLFAPGFVSEPGKLELTISLTRWVFPYIFCVSLVALMSGILNSVRHFAAPALSPVILNVCIIAAAVFLTDRVDPPIYAVAYGVLAGGVLQVILQIPPLVSRGFTLWPRWQPRHEANVRILRLMGPMVFGAAVYQINLMFDTILASVLPNGSVSYLWYAGRVFEFPLGIVAVALGTAALPSFSAQAARGAYEELAESILFSMRLTSFIAIPAGVGIGLLAQPITAVLFERGAFSYAEAQLTAAALMAFAGGLWSVSMVRVLVPAFYAMQDTRTPVTTAAAAFVANIACSLMLMGPIAASGDSAVESGIAALTQHLAVADLRHVGLAVATSVSATVNFVLLGAMLRRRVPSLQFSSLVPALLRNIAASGVMAAVIIAVAGTVTWEHASFPLRVIGLTAAVGSGLITYLGISWAAGSEEIASVRRAILRRRS